MGPGLKFYNERKHKINKSLKCCAFLICDYRRNFWIFCKIRRVSVKTALLYFKKWTRGNMELQIYMNANNNFLKRFRFNERLSVFKKMEPQQKKSRFRQKLFKSSLRMSFPHRSKTNFKNHDQNIVKTSDLEIFANFMNAFATFQHVSTMNNF